MAAPVFAQEQEAAATAEYHTVSFYTDGGSEIDPIKTDAKGEITVPKNPTKEGYTFAGWSETATGDVDSSIKAGETYKGAATAKADVTLYANWTKKSTASGVKDVTYGVTTGGTYVFTAELKDEKIGKMNYVVELTTGGKTYTSFLRNDNADQEVTENKIAVAFAQTAGTTDDAQDGKIDFVGNTKASNYTLPTLTNGTTVSVKVYAFEDEAITYDDIQASKGTALFTKTIKIDHFYTVTLDSNGGTFETTTGSLTKQKVNIGTGEAIGEVEEGTGNVTWIASGYTSQLAGGVYVEPTRAKYNFTGWYTDKDCTTLYTPDSKVTEDITLYAGWSLKTAATVTFKEVNYATDMAVAQRTLKGYVNTLPEAGNVFYAILTGKYADKTPYIVEVTVGGVSYRKVIATGTASDARDQAMYISLAEGGKVDFIGTDKTAAGKLTDTTAPTIADGATATIKVYTYTGIQAAGYTEDNKVYDAPTAWSDVKGLKVVASKTFTINSAYTVTFDTQDGNTTTASVKSGTKAAQPDAPEREGYTFAGWYTDKACTKAYDFDTLVSANVTLYAKWDIDSNNVAGATIATIKNVAYTGEAQTPALTVTLGDKTLVEGTDYTVAYTNNTEVGCATATITGIGAYTGTNARNFVVVPQQVTGLKAIKKTATTLKLQFNAVKGADGYAIYDAATGKRLATVSTQNGASVLKKTITGLKAGETRKYKVRAYKIVNGTKRYAEYSAVYTKATAKK
jgi:uncharacterized repeat protein (TIGR02543 family)